MCYELFCVQASSLALVIAVLVAVVKGLREKVPCVENDKFYRNPNRDPSAIWATGVCSKYYLCIEKEVFNFECSTGLNFDVQRQICDFKEKVSRGPQHLDSRINT